MSRHGRKVPASFYRRFAQDATRFADAHARGRLVSVLEGGYSDRALTSGALAHLVGLAAVPAERVRESWWAVPALEKVRAPACAPGVGLQCADGMCDSWRRQRRGDAVGGRALQPPPL
jgi:histone deacetylase HOS3